MPEIPDPPPSQQVLPNAVDPSPGDGEEASVRLLLDVLVKRLMRHPLELAERAVGQKGIARDRNRPCDQAS